MLITYRRFYTLIRRDLESQLVLTLWSIRHLRFRRNFCDTKHWFNSWNWIQREITTFVLHHVLCISTKQNMLILIRIKTQACFFFYVPHFWRHYFERLHDFFFLLQNCSKYYTEYYNGAFFKTFGFKRGSGYCGVVLKSNCFSHGQLKVQHFL